MERRRPVYREVATLVVGTDGRTAADVAQEIAGVLGPGVPTQAGEAP